VGAKLVRIFVIAFACLSSGVPPALAAEPPALDLAGSYALVEAVGVGNNYPTGWLGSVGWYVNGTWGVVGEFGRSYHTTHTVIGSGLPDLDATVDNVMGGVKIRAGGGHRVNPFLQVLLGEARFANNYSDKSISHLTWQLGGGAEVGMTRSLAIRLQGDYRFISADGANLKEFRLSTGVVFRR